MFDVSEHGCSDGSGRGLSYGIRECRDVLAAAQYMRDVHGAQSVATIGTSVGGASVIMAAYQVLSLLLTWLLPPHLCLP